MVGTERTYFLLNNKAVNLHVLSASSSACEKALDKLYTSAPEKAVQGQLSLIDIAGTSVSMFLSTWRLNVEVARVCSLYYPEMMACCCELCACHPIRTSVAASAKLQNGQEQHPTYHIISLGHEPLVRFNGFVLLNQLHVLLVRLLLVISLGI